MEILNHLSEFIFNVKYFSTVLNFIVSGDFLRTEYYPQTLVFYSFSAVFLLIAILRYKKEYKSSYASIILAVISVWFSFTIHAASEYKGLGVMEFDPSIVLSFFLMVVAALIPGVLREFMDSVI